MDDQGYQDWPLTAGNIANGYTVGEYGDYRYRGVPGASCRTLRTSLSETASRSRMCTAAPYALL
eukprot:3978663-Prymnesium_polylepis.1